MARREEGGGGGRLPPSADNQPIGWYTLTVDTELTSCTFTGTLSPRKHKRFTDDMLSAMRTVIETHRAKARFLHQEAFPWHDADT